MKIFYKKRNEYWKYFFSMSNFDGIFYSQNLSADDKQKLFLKLVCVVNLELSTYCNRKCSYCPLAYNPRSQEYMPQDIFRKIIGELHDMHYCGYMMLNFYNEPLLDINLLSKIEYVRKMLPNVAILFNSNGDYLNRELLEKLFSVGLNQIIVTLHVSPNQIYEDENRRETMNRFLKKLSLEKYFDNRAEKFNRSIILDIPFAEDKKILICTNNWAEYGNNRGGALEHLHAEQRINPCVNPFREICIAYDGTIKPCCNIYFNAPNIFGNAAISNLTDIYFGEELCKFRRELFIFSKKVGGCATCNTEDNAEIKSQVMRKNILNI